MNREKEEETNDNHDNNIDRNDVDDENITTPGRHHIEVAKSTASRDQERTSVHRLEMKRKERMYFHPEIEGEDHSENGVSFVIVGTSNGTRDIGRNQTYKSSSKKSSVGTTSSLKMK